MSINTQKEEKNTKRVTLALRISPNLQKAIKVYALMKGIKLRELAQKSFSEYKKKGKIRNLAKFSSTEKRVFNLIVPSEFRKSVKISAAAEGITMSDLMEKVLLEYMENNP